MMIILDSIILARGQWLFTHPSGSRFIYIFMSWRIKILLSRSSSLLLCSLWAALVELLIRYVIRVSGYYIILQYQFILLLLLLRGLKWHSRTVKELWLLLCPHLVSDSRVLFDLNTLARSLEINQLITKWSTSVTFKGFSCSNRMVLLSCLSSRSDHHHCQFVLLI